MCPSKTKQAAESADVISGQPKPRVRDRIFATACELFYRHGIHEVGVETIAGEAGTNKMSFYRSFASKDELVAEYLKEQAREALAWWDGVVAPYEGNAQAQVEAMFEAMAAKTSCREPHGCALANAAVELEEDHPARKVIEAFKTEVHRRLRELARRMHAHDPDALGDGLMLLLEGSKVTRLTFKPNHGPAHSAAKAARRLMEAHLQLRP